MTRKEKSCRLPLQRFDQGSTLAEAAVQAAKERLRQILMTSFAFIFGTLPLAVATGAGAHVAIGTAVVGGTVGATILVIFLVPMFFVLVLRLFRVRPKSQTAPSELALIAPAPQSGN
jgi:multidrug efflux pump